MGINLTLKILLEICLYRFRRAADYAFVSFLLNLELLNTTTGFAVYLNSLKCVLIEMQ